MRLKALLTVTIMLLGTSLGCIAWETLTPAATLPPSASQLPQPTPTSIPELPPVVTLSPEGALLELQSQVEAVYAAVGDSVVNIAVTSLAYDFFMNPVPQEGSGSGFIYDAEGHIVTNYHVVQDVTDIQVIFSDGNMLPATVVGSDPANDLAVLKVDPTAHSVKPMVLGRSDDLRVGQFVVAIGNPFGLEQTLTFGVISSLGRVIESPEYNRFIGEAIQTDAAINPGNSGGPLLDLEGRVIGVNAQIISPSQANAGIGFAIPANTVRRVVPELIATGRYPHPWLGVNLLDLSRWAETLQAAREDVPNEGLMILEVVGDSPAAESGLRGGQRFINLGNVRRFPVGGDIIIALNGVPVKTYSEFSIYLELNTRVGETLSVTVLRDGQEQLIPVVLEERPEQ
ncbi:MAG: Serine protease Do-like HtrA [Chloroflexi bacterium ADurb.Bin222]|nr:MAG: Serine protease Do-like HtrA [Chloroflexi bacterium ADurb.Bin222]